MNQTLNSITDLFSAAQNLVRVVNYLGDAYATVNGKLSSDNLGAATTTVISNQSGRLASISVTDAGSTPGIVYDSRNTTVGSINRLATIPNTVGVHTMNIPYTNGLVVTTGTGQTVTVIYS